MKKKRWLMVTAAALILGGCLGLGAKAPAAQVEAKTKVLMKDKTPKEPAGSDLAIVQTVTKLESRRWIQSFTYDSTYYYFIQMTKPSVGNLRITRVKYKGLGRYTTAKMDLRGFGHATNLDCSVYNGRTYLWTGSNAAKNSDVSRAVTCFTFQKNRILKKNGPIYYKIPKGNGWEVCDERLSGSELG